MNQYTGFVLSLEGSKGSVGLADDWKKLKKLLMEGWIIVSAVQYGGGIFYILEKTK